MFFSDMFRISPVFARIHTGDEGHQCQPEVAAEEGHGGKAWMAMDGLELLQMACIDMGVSIVMEVPQ